MGLAHDFKSNIVKKSFRRFVREWCKRNLEVLSPDALVTFDEWLENSNYNGSRKQELREAKTRIEEGKYEGADDFEVHAFIKDEPYVDFKYLRIIAARIDEAKVRLAPIFRTIEKSVFKRGEFIKKIPHPDRAEYIVDRLGTAGPYYVTDYTAYESSMIKEMWESVEFQVYKHVGQNLPGFREWFALVKRFSGVNRIKLDGIDMKINGVRMSGEMNTSLGNGLVNLLIMEYVAYKNGTTVKGVVEGDDGLFTAGKELDMSYIEDLPVKLKLEVVQSIGEASFCGLIFEEDDKQLLADPFKTIGSLTSTGRKYCRASEKMLLALQRLKALSAMYTVPSCPLVWALCKYILSETATVQEPQLLKIHNNLSEGKWTREQFDWDELIRAKPIEPSEKTRVFFETRFGVPVSHQLQIEEDLLEGNYSSLLYSYFPENWKLYHHFYGDNTKGHDSPLLGMFDASFTHKQAMHSIVLGQ
jgi:hypothetical protein